MVFAKLATTIAALGVLGAHGCPVLDSLAAQGDAAPPSLTDLARARLPRPVQGESPVAGKSAAEAFRKMNLVLEADPVSTQACDTYDHASLNDIARILHTLRDATLDDHYRSKKDRRAMHFDGLAAKEALWMAEDFAATQKPSHAPGGVNWVATRDGKCAELVMWYVHHLSESQRLQLSKVDAFTLPLMPGDVAPEAARSTEYDQQIGCTSCHVAVHIPGAPPIGPIPLKNSSAPQYPTNCPKDEKTGLPSVWYEEEQSVAGNRTKRCDWDYVPFCEPCEGVGGMIWGSGEHDWKAMPCEPVAKPEDIPAANLTSPLWPENFLVSEYASLTFPGRDPCNIKFKNSTYDLYFETRDDGPVYHTVGKTGPSGPSPFPGKSWAVPNGNFYTTVDVLGKSTFCTCLGNADPVVDNAVTGPLSFDFNKGAKLIGRERVKPEYMDHEIVADHWVKGPHHFWINVETNQMVREWQPFNGLQTYYNWTALPAKIEVEKICTSGILKFNVSCKYPSPEAPPQ